MNQDQRTLRIALRSLGWGDSQAFRNMERGDVTARIYPCRSIDVIRIKTRAANGGWTGDTIETVQPLYGRGWHLREARIVDALASSTRPAKELGILLHALGGGNRSRTPLGWRTHFCPGGDDVALCEALAADGLMVRSTRIGVDTFTVTNAGAAAVGVDIAS